MNLNESQRAMVAARLANLGDGQRASSIEGAVSQPQAAALLNVGRASVERAKQVQRDAANRARSEAQAGVPKSERPATSCGDTSRDHSTETGAKTATARATASRTNRGAVERMGPCPSSAS